MGILDALQGRQTYLDANVFIYALNAFPAFEAALRALFTAIEAGDVRCVTSQLTLAELLVKPFRERDQGAVASCRRAVADRAGLSISPVTLDVLVEAAKQRAAHGLRLPDAIHVATARLTGCTVILTNDTAVTGSDGIEVICLSDAART
ncbi:MAG TPA: type II toxin-antitoxin system VapC family toxin [Planctomycetota bacterium]|nr:type II toxin-antitoxin system VapC family toxin [Planctomycetota bacterium]HRR82086.1 type II toxin-antitoxin system VapC family toxin [Planctomycetota bacterium]HRT96449.1 type II toxin-antitoxin system VapC family toxin [Planctomycetota bacterium]